MRSHIEGCLPEEGCGLIGGREGRGQMVYPVENELHNPRRFRMAGEGQLRVFQQMEEKGLELLAIYHSHPAGPPQPSETDLAEFAYPGVAYLIWSPDEAGWQVRGFLIAGLNYQEIDLIWVEAA